MIFQPFIDIGCFFLDLILSNMKTISISIPQEVFSSLDMLFSGLGYFFPVRALMPILVISGTFGMLRLIVAVVVRIKSFIPFMGN